MIILPNDAAFPNNPRIGYDTDIANASLSADEEAAGYPASNLRNPATYLQWRGTSTAAQNVVANMDGNPTVDYLGIAVHNLGSAGITYTLERSDDAVSWTPIVSDSPADDGAIIHEFDEVTDAFFRLALTSGSVAPRIGVWYLGQMLVMTRRIYVGHTPVTLARQRQVSTGRSESGQFLGRVQRRETLPFNISVQNLAPAWVRSTLDGFLEVSDVTPFFWSWRPTDYPAEVAYCWTDGDPAVVNARANGYMDFQASVQGVP